jgi:hypothetical protein
MIPSRLFSATGLAGLEARHEMKELTGRKDKTGHSTQNIAVGGNPIIIAWPNDVVTIETIAD